SAPYQFADVSPDGRLLVVSGTEDLRLWDRHTGKLLVRRAALPGPICFSPDGEWLACATFRAIHLLAPRTLKVVRVFAPHHQPHGCFALCCSPDGKWLALGSDHVVTLWDVKTGKTLPRPPGHVSVVCSLAFSPDGRRLASGGQDGVAHVWDLSSSRALHV